MFYRKRRKVDYLEASMDLMNKRRVIAYLKLEGVFPEEAAS